ncbi:hypothetical protein [Rhodohalobacter sp. SW132]|uniref:hypothetical protein n=1 Tax=Rhodohalobacter sp. SW132 TaxID=2293433 RepID=UPI0011C0312E|nr:hypothetical protein [Rhodohalobacter sp. SW132]
MEYQSLQLIGRKKQSSDKDTLSTIQLRTQCETQQLAQACPSNSSNQNQLNARKLIASTGEGYYNCTQPPCT